MAGPIAAVVTRLGDIRRGEGAIVARAAAGLFFMVAAHTTLETVRDALVLSHFPTRELPLVYVAIAIGVVPGTSLISWSLRRKGLAPTLRAGLLAVAVACGVLFLVPITNASVLALCVATSLVPAALVPVFWNLLGGVFTIAQGRRLLGTVAASGGLGAATGSLLAAGTVRVVSLQALLAAAAVGLIAAAFLLSSGQELRHATGGPEVATARSDAPPTLGRDPFARRIALLVALSTAAFVVLDFSFKWTLVKTVPQDRVPLFVARYYALLNGGALVVQLTMGRTLLRRLSMATNILITPTLFVAGAVAALVLGGAGSVVVALKGADGILRNSLHRVTMELLYLPLSTEERLRVKPFIDGTLARTVQGAVGALLFAMTTTIPPSLAILVIFLLVVSAAWLAAALRTRGPYVALLRRSVAGEMRTFAAADPLDLESAEALVEFLSDDDPALVVGAMNALARRGRLRLVPGLILLHSHEAVLTRALHLFASSPRRDWSALARRLLVHDREPVRLAAARALALRGQIGPGDLAEDTSPRARAYAALHATLRGESTEPTEDPVVVGIVGRPDAVGEAGRLGLMDAIADLSPASRLHPILGALAKAPADSREWRVAFARAVSAQKAAGPVPLLIRLLEHRDGREAVRTAIATFGDGAIELLRDALGSPSTPRPVRIHIPNTLTHFGSSKAAHLLLDTIEGDADGLVRYKALRALGRLVSEQRLKMDRGRIEALASASVIEHFRLIGLRAPFESPASIELPRQGSSGEVIGPSGSDPSERLLVGLLDDKLRQSLERTFRLLKIAMPNEDVHRIYEAIRSGDKHVRANAGELLDVLLRRSHHTNLHALLLVLAEESSFVERLERAEPTIGRAHAHTREAVLASLAKDRDPMLAALARLHAAATSGRTERVAFSSPVAGSIELAVEAQS
jgi:AAA family ATP:ADP antiporter